MLLRFIPPQPLPRFCRCQSPSETAATRIGTRLQELLSGVGDHDVTVVSRSRRRDVPPEGVHIRVSSGDDLHRRAVAPRQAGGL